MLSFTSAPTYFILSASCFQDLTLQPTPLTLSETNASGRGNAKKRNWFLPLKDADCLLGFVDKNKRNYKDSWWGLASGVGLARRCKKGGWECEGDFALEAEILAFMDNSENPEHFPTKKQLIDAGRMDLAEAIVKQGGWLASGWDLDDSDFSNNEHDVDLYMINDKECNNQESSPEVSVSHVYSDTASASSSARTLKTAVEDDSGIEGILSRLEKERNMTFGVEPDMWRTWSIQRAVHPDRKFEAAEIPSNRTSRDVEIDTSGDVVQETGEAGGDYSNRMKENSALEGIDQSQIRSRLQNMELELSSVLQALKSNNAESLLQNDRENSSSDLLKLYDAWEFQENEVMNAHNRLRSTRAKLAVLEGKMALAIINAQKMVEGRRKRIGDSRRALQLLRTACIVWPNSASEVLLAGSFDGWGVQRKMKKSSTGIFSIDLKLYPGKYEIKFVVDGEWRIDPLRPTVRSNGYENNLLIIT